MLLHSLIYPSTAFIIVEAFSFPAMGNFVQLANIDMSLFVSAAH